MIKVSRFLTLCSARLNLTGNKIIRCTLNERDGFSSWLQSFDQQWSLKLKSLKWNDSQTDRKQSYIQTLPWGHWGHWWVLRKSTGRWQERSNDGALLLTTRAGPPRALSVWPLTSAPLMSELQHMFNDSADRGEMSSNKSSFLCS